MSQKRILMLGGSYFQIPAIKYAKKKGYYVIICDFLPDNPGHKFSDEYYNISTTDKEAVLELAKKLKIDGVIAYASDPAAPTAAYIAENLKLPGNSYDSVKILTEKDLFRSFLSKNNFNVPKAIGGSFIEDILVNIDLLTFPLMIKPVDSSGSKGVVKVNELSELNDAFNYALSFSRKRRIVVEEFINNCGPQLHGDAFVVEGKLIFCYLGDHHFNLDKNPYVPYSTTLPSIHKKTTLANIELEIQRLIDILQLKQGAFNIEARMDCSGNIYLMEVGPRNGGNLVPQLEQYATGFNMVASSVDIALGIYNSLGSYSKKGYFAYYVLHSKNDGKLKKIELDLMLDTYILEKHIFKKEGDAISAFNGSNATIGVLLLQFNSAEEQINIVSNMDEFIKLDLA